MSGHSKWSTIKRKKGALDAKRGKIFSKLAKEISVAAKIGGGDPDGNPRLRTIMIACRAANMPKDKIDTAIKKGTGEGDSVNYEETRYEGYGAGGVAVIIDVLTDNKNRTVADIRYALTKNNGSLAENGAVTWNFEPKGFIAIDKEACSEEDMFDKAIEAGADDVRMETDTYEIITEPSDLHAVAEGLESQGLKLLEAKLTMLPKTTTEIGGSDAKQVLRLIEMLEDNEDVQEVYSNFDISDEVMAELMAQA